MTVALLLPWFPIVLAVAVAGRVLGKTRGGALGLLCSLFWILTVLATTGDGVWQSGWTVLSLLAGTLAIVFVGRWSGDVFAHEDRERSPSTELSQQVPAYAFADAHAVTRCIDSFEDWLEQHRNDGDPWTAFDDFVRTLLYEQCQATHVRPYRLLSNGEDLIPLRTHDTLMSEDSIPSRRGIIGHVVTSGQSYIAGLPSQGELIHALADDAEDSVAWCFAIRRSAQRVGVVTVGQVDISSQRLQAFGRTMEKLVNRFWNSVAEVQCSRSAEQVDPVSSLHTRPAFLRLAESSLESSYAQGEPVGLAVIAFEGLRELNDSGKWEVADDLLHEVSTVLRRKIRLDDCIGRFDGSRIVLLIRRVDSDLASLIVKQMLAKVGEVCSDTSRWGVPIAVRCGLAGSGMDQPKLRSLVSSALMQSRRARIEDQLLVSDLSDRTKPVPSGASS